MLSPSVSVTAPETAPTANPTTPTTRRRGLSYLRNLSQGRSGAVSPGEGPRSARSYFQRSISFNDKNHSSSSLPSRARERSLSRPNEPTSPLGELHSPVLTTSPTSPTDVRRERPLSAENPTATPFPDLESAQTSTNGTSDSMVRTPLARSRANTANSQGGPVPAAISNGDGAVLQATTTNASVTRGDGQEVEAKTQLPTLRFLSHQEMRNGRQSLNFAPVSRTLPNEQAIIRVGRYSEREGIPPTNPNGPSDAPVGFKSKVVSRKHCEFSCTGGQWHIKDVGSSSGTFLNHIRLSQPNTESKAFPIKDGDIVQLGIDFRGGEEMIFRCVKIRVEVNRSWQKKPNQFNKSRHAQLQGLAKEQAVANGNNSGECSICLGNVLPCQALFVAPCAHAWHYKCIRPMLDGSTSQYPQFQCPNCRAYFDLSADVDVEESDVEDWKDKGESSAHEELPESAVPVITTTNGETAAEPAAVNGTVTPPAITHTAPSPVPDPLTSPSSDPLMSPSISLGSSGLLARRQLNNPSSSEIASVRSIDMPNKEQESNDIRPLDTQMTTRAETPDNEPVMSADGPMTPMNDVGPFVFDGSGQRLVRARVVNIPELIEGTT